MATTTKQLNTAYDSLSSALSTLTSGTDSADVETANQQTCTERATVLANLLRGKIRKGTSDSLVTMCWRLVTKSVSTVMEREEIGFEGLRQQADEYRARLQKRAAQRAIQNSGLAIS